jgi:hypothetical protein
MLIGAEYRSTLEMSRRRHSHYTAATRIHAAVAFSTLAQPCPRNHLPAFVSRGPARPHHRRYHRGRLIVAMGALSHNIDVRGEAIRAADGHEPTQADLDRIRAGLGSDH